MWITTYRFCRGGKVSTLTICCKVDHQNVEEGGQSDDHHVEAVVDTYNDTYMITYCEIASQPSEGKW